MLCMQNSGTLNLNHLFNFMIYNIVENLNKLYRLRFTVQQMYDGSHMLMQPGKLVNTGSYP